MGGAMSATGVLFVVLLAFGVSAGPLPPEPGEVQFPGWLFLPLFGARVVHIFKPHLARHELVTPFEGLVLGSLSRLRRYGTASRPQAP